MKKLGRMVTPFDEETWSKAAVDTVTQGNLLKFEQNVHARRLLIGSGERIIAEAAPRDAVWGIGCGAENPKAQNQQEWRGKNLLGQALMAVRKRMRKMFP